MSENEHEKWLAMEVAYGTLQEALEGISIAERALENAKQMAMVSSVHIDSLRNWKEDKDADGRDNEL